jgi:acetolactate synthase small subunit
MEHTFNLAINDKAGIIIRIAMVLERRGYTISHIQIHPEKTNEGFSQMTIKASGDLLKKEQIIKQFEKLVDVYSAKDIGENYIEKKQHAVLLETVAA